MSVWVCESYVKSIQYILLNRSITNPYVCKQLCDEYVGLLQSITLIIHKLLKAYEGKAHQWLKIFRSRIDVFDFLHAAMAVSNPFVKLDSAYG